MWVMRLAQNAVRLLSATPDQIFGKLKTKVIVSALGIGMRAVYGFVHRNSPKPTVGTLMHHALAHTSAMLLFTATVQHRPC